jgi:hypothetical protein
MRAKIKLNTSLRGNPKDSIIRIKVTEDEYGDYIPKDIYWRQRLKDSEIDNCIEFVYPDVEVINIVEVEKIEPLKKMVEKRTYKRKYTKKEPKVEEPFNLDE